MHDFAALRQELSAALRHGRCTLREGVGAVSAIGAGINATFANLRRFLAALAGMGAPSLGALDLELPHQLPPRGARTWRRRSAASTRAGGAGRSLQPQASDLRHQGLPREAQLARRARAVAAVPGEGAGHELPLEAPARVPQAGPRRSGAGSTSGATGARGGSARVRPGPPGGSSRSPARGRCPARRRRPGRPVTSGGSAGRARPRAGRRSRTKCRARTATSPPRSRSGGRASTIGRRRYIRSSRKRPAATRASRSTLAARQHADVRAARSRSPPRRRYSFSWTKRRSLAWPRGVSSATSSRKSVPPSAAGHVPLAGRDRSREGAADVAEHLRLEQLVGEGRRVDGHEGSAAAPGAAVDRHRHALLARPRLAEDVDRDLGVGDPGHVGEQGLHGRAAAHELGEDLIPRRASRVGTGAHGSGTGGGHGRGDRLVQAALLLSRDR